MGVLDKDVVEHIEGSESIASKAAMTWVTVAPVNDSSRETTLFNKFGDRTSASMMSSPSSHHLETNW